MEVEEDVRLESTAYYAAAVFVGRVTDVGAGQMTTANRTPGASVVSPSRASVYTPVSIEVNTAIRGVQTGEAVDVQVQGGEIGCNRVIYSNPPTDLSVGQQYVVFMIDAGRVAESGRLLALWPVTDGLVRTPADGTLTIEELAARVQAAGYEPFPTIPAP